MAAGATPLKGGETSPGGGPADRLKALDAGVLTEPERKAAVDAMRERLRARIRDANSQSSARWGEIRNRGDWERFRDARLALLRKSLGTMPQAPARLNLHTTRTIPGNGYRIRSLAFESRPGLWVTANLYLPDQPPESMPGMLICHSHHTPKEHGELQDMGMTWARKGCAVLVMDQLGHGERRQHPFRTADDYARSFRVGRQDYYFRYDVGMQLHLVGESLMGWMVWDLMRGVDVLLATPGVDPARVVLLGAVAGGGDPAAVAAALDRRIAAAVPFNFGGPQPETAYPLPDDAEKAFNYAGSGSWESTRNLRRSAVDGFLPWVIVGSIAPRGLVYAHEFRWDRSRDPVWQRLQVIWGFYDRGETLAFAHGRGSLKGRPPESSHCTHIGRVHREMIHPALNRWLDVSITPQDEYSERRGADELEVWTPELRNKLEPRPLCELLEVRAGQQSATARKALAKVAPEARRTRLRADWARILGPIEPKQPSVRRRARDAMALNGASVERVVLDVEPGIPVPLVLLVPEHRGDEPALCVVAVAQSGKQAFLKDRAAEIAELIEGGAAVCLPDLRGQGETRPDASRERWSAATAHSSTDLMLGGTAVGARLGDLRSVLEYLRGRSDVAPGRIVLWGDSFARPNPPETDYRVPRNVGGRPRGPEPLGGLLALLAGLYDEQVAAVYVRGGLTDYHSVLSSPFVYIPHDVVIPGVLTVGDLPQLAAALAPRPLRLEAPVDGLNRAENASAALGIYGAAVASYQKARAGTRISIGVEAKSPAQWLAESLNLP
jgi:cephalosporin-C deacetylase-like acetyl esterase